MSVKTRKGLYIITHQFVKQLQSPKTHQKVPLTSYTAQKEAVKSRNTWKAASKK